MFPSVPPSTDQHELHNQRISTKLFIFFFTVLVAILLFYTSLIKITKTITVEAPPFAQYKLLYSTYSPTLTCPCAKISTNYEEFLHVEYTLHQVCNSTLVNQNWIDYFSALFQTRWSGKDFRLRSPSAFQALSTFCELINRTISDNLIEFYSRQYVSASVTPLHLFTSETESSIYQFRSLMTSEFLSSLAKIRYITKANALFSGLQTNYVLRIAANNYYVETDSMIYKDCLCRSLSTCIEESAIYQLPSSTRVFDVPGFYTGCYVIESLLQSSLECFYNQSCIDKLRAYLPSSAPMKETMLDSSLPSHYFINSTIEDLVDHLMIEQWNASPIYEKYYNGCQPTQCTYTDETRNDVLYIVTTLFGIVGGLITVLKFIVPRLVKILRKKKELPQPPMGKTKSRNNKYETQLRCLKKKHASF